jgi:Cysteine rich repeat
MKYMLMPIALLLVASAGAVVAADQPASTSPRVACKADVDKLCPGIQPGGGRIIACLKQNRAQVSAGCKDALAKAREKKAPVAPVPPEG